MAIKQNKNEYKVLLKIAKRLYITIHDESSAGFSVQSKRLKPMHVRNWSLAETRFRYTTNEARRPRTAGMNMVTYWEDKKYGFKTFLKHILRLYNPSLIDDCRFSRYPDIWIWTMNFLRAHQKTLDSASLEFRDIDDDEVLNTVLDDVSLIRELSINGMKPSQNYIETDQRVYSNDNLIVNYGYWVTLPRLLIMTSPHVTLTYTRFTNQDLNIFLKSWMRLESNQTFKRVCISLVDLDIQLVLQDIEYVENEEREVLTLDNHFRCDPYDVRRCDGVVASVYKGEPENDFEMQVWVS